MFPGHFRERQLWETQNRLSLGRNGKHLADTYRQFLKLGNFVFLIHYSSGADCKCAFLGHAQSLRSHSREIAPNLSSEKP